MHVDTLPEMFRTRLCKFSPVIAECVPGIDFQKVALSLSSIKPYFAMCVLRTFCNGWSTTARYHDGVSLSCIFGCKYCPNSDCISHYLNCPLHRDAINSSLGEPHGTGILERLGLSDLSPRSFLRLSIACATYHCMKSSLRAGCAPLALFDAVVSTAMLAHEAHPSILADVNKKIEKKS